MCSVSLSACFVARWVTMFQRLVSFFKDRGVACPVTSLRTDAEWTVLVLDQNLMQQPCMEARRTVARGSLEVKGEYVWGVCDHPDDGHFHGTDVETVMQVLHQGRFQTAKDLGFVPHSPNGIYSYPDLDRSNASSYVHQGAQIRFTVVSLPVSYKGSLWIEKECKDVPTGISCRRQRSGIKKWGAAKGTEWCHNPDSIRIDAIRIKTYKLQEFLIAGGAFQYKVCFANFVTC